MRKKGKKLREIRFHSRKNDQIVIVHSNEELRYAKRLEEDGSVAAYIYGKDIDKVKLSLIPKVDIRGDYLKEDWCSDFYIVSMDGSVSIRELIADNDLSKLSEIEKLELSRRYWKSVGVADWKIVMGGKKKCLLG